MNLNFYQGKKVFITGHTGFKGAWLTRILLNAGAEVIGYSLEPPTKENLFSLLNLADNMISNIGDIRDIEFLQKKISEAKAEIIFHLAAQPLVLDSYENPRYTYETNVMGTVNILECIRKADTVKSFVNITTDKVYKNNEWEWGYRENEELCGFDPYSNSKSCSELVTYAYKKSFGDTLPPISTARSGNVIGGGDYAKNRIIPDCIRAAANNEEIVVRNPHSIRPYQHVLECLSGYLILAKKQYEDKSLAGAYNFGPNEESCVTTGDLVTLFCKHWGNISWKNINKENSLHEANFLKLDCAKAKKNLYWYPKWNIDTAIKKIVDWQKAIQNGMSAENITDEQIKEYFM